MQEGNFVYPTGSQENQNSQSYSCFGDEFYLIKTKQKQNRKDEIIELLLENHFWHKFKLELSLGDTLYPIHGHMDRKSLFYGGCREVVVRRTPQF